jgi:ABC-type multidrug transport system fused ATPase/permease subunit
MLGSTKNLMMALKPKERRSLLVILMMLLIAVGFETISVAVVLPMLTTLTKISTVDQAAIDKITFFQFYGNSAIVIGSIALMTVFLLKALYLTLNTWVQKGFTTGLEYRISSDLFSGYVSQPYLFHLNSNSSELVRRSNSASVISTGYVEPLLTIIGEGSVVIAILIFIVIKNPIATLVSGIGASALLFGFQMVSRRIVNQFAEARENDEIVRVKTINEGLMGIREMKVFNKTSFYVSRYNKSALNVSKANRTFSTVLNAPRNFLEPIFLVFVSISVTVSLWINTGSENLIANVGLLAAAGYRVMPSVNQIFSAIHTARFHSPIIQKIIKDLNLEPSLEIRTKHIAVSESITEYFEVNSLSYNFPGQPKYLFRDLSFTVKRGEILGIKGESGAGKSTLINVLIGLLAPSSGSINFYSHNNGGSGKPQNSIVGYVPQEIFLLDETIRRNIAFGEDESEIDENYVVKAVDACALRELIDSLPNGLNTRIGERGVRLSGGQRQRIGIARALYINPRVLILDESTSALDSETETSVMQSVENLSQNFCTIIVSHRESTLAMCNKVIELV